MEPFIGEIRIFAGNFAPFGWALFYLRSVAPPEVPTLAIYKGVVPFIMLQLIALVLVYSFPNIATWLPRAIGW